MESKTQTKVDDFNRADFYCQVYHHQKCHVSELVDVSALSLDQIVVIDSCGWYYKKCFPGEKIIALENVKTALEYRLSRDQFDKLFDGRSDSIPGWPNLKVESPGVVFDRSPLLKYQTLANLINILQSVVDTYHPPILVVKQNLMFIDDNRLTDRIKNIATIELVNYVITKFYYDTEKEHLDIHFRVKKKL